MSIESKLRPNLLTYIDPLSRLPDNTVLSLDLHPSNSGNTNYESVLDMNGEDWELSDPCDDLDVIPATDTGMRIHEDRFSSPKEIVDEIKSKTNIDPRKLKFVHDTFRGFFLDLGTAGGFIKLYEI